MKGIKILEVVACYHTQSISLQKGLGYFNHILVTSVAFLLHVWHIKFKDCLQFEPWCS